jgi:bHLH factor
MHRRHRPQHQLVAAGETLQWEVMNGRDSGKTIMYAPYFPCLTFYSFIGCSQKEVERRRRGNINDGINELGRIVPSGNGEKAKGAILARSVQYIHHLKENEARNIEKWTLEKLLMDQAMGDLQNQLEEVKRMWEEERNARQRLELELETTRKGSAASQPAPQHQVAQPPGGTTGEAISGAKRKSEEVPEQTSGAGENEGDRDGKRQRTE